MSSSTLEHPTPGLPHLSVLQTWSLNIRPFIAITARPIRVVYHMNFRDRRLDSVEY